MDRSIPLGTYVLGWLGLALVGVALVLGVARVARHYLSAKS
jgi:hypothetical protein